MASRIFFLLNILILIYFFRHETIETHACAFLRLIILAIGTVRLICGTIVSVTIFSTQNYKRAYLAHCKKKQNNSAQKLKFRTILYPYKKRM